MKITEIKNHLENKINKIKGNVKAYQIYSDSKKIVFQLVDNTGNIAYQVYKRLNRYTSDSFSDCGIVERSEAVFTKI